MYIYFSEDFAQFASNFRWHLQARESRGHRAPVNDRLRSRRFRGRHTPYTNLWDSVSPPGARRDALLAEFTDFTPRPVPSGDNSSPIVIDEEVFVVLILKPCHIIPVQDNIVNSIMSLILQCDFSNWPTWKSGPRITNQNKPTTLKKMNNES